MRSIQKVLVCAMLVLTPGLLTAGCATSQKQVRYFAAANLAETKSPLTFYRLTISARSMNSKTEFIAGFYDANTVRQLYGEVVSSSEPHSMNLDPLAGQYCLQYENGNWHQLPDSALYTVFYGADASELANQIKLSVEQAAQNEDIGALVRAALAGEQSLKVKEAQAQVAGLRQKAAILSEGLTGMLPKMNDDEKEAQLLAAGKQILAALCASMGESAPSVSNMKDLNNALSVLELRFVGSN